MINNQHARSANNFFKECICLLIGCWLVNYVNAQVAPSRQQLQWQEQEFYIFTHFGPNTFTDKEWGQGDEPEDIFNPTQFDAAQWCRIAKQAGAKGIIITAKHHDGFCLWPSSYSKHTVRESKWRNGKGDVLSDLSRACKKYGLLFGVYISPWDRNHPDYGTEKYNTVFVNMMRELFTNYGPIWELWWDGANGEGPNGKKQVYNWTLFKETVKKLSPNTVVFSDVGPHIRWVGNEQGIAGETNWNTLDTTGFSPGAGAPGTDTLTTGNRYGKAWIPAECDVSIRPGWFYHANEDEKVKTPQQLFELYLKSVGRGANLLLNVPPDRRGRIHENDSAALMGFRDLRKVNFKNNLARSGSAYIESEKIAVLAPVLNDANNGTSRKVGTFHSGLAGIQFKTPQTINCVVIRENLSSGQHCAGFELILLDETGTVVKKISGTTIGRKRILHFDKTTVIKLQLIINDADTAVPISEIEAYLIEESLVKKI
jgi:alpha-L-fucosidase